MERSFGPSFLFRGAAAALAALLLSAPALAAPCSARKSSCYRSADAPACCCMEGDAPQDSSASCCRLSAPEEAAPSLQSTAFLVLAAPAVTTRDLPDPPLTASLSGPARRVAPRARSAPLHLLYSVLLV